MQPFFFIFIKVACVYTLYTYNAHVHSHTHTRTHTHAHTQYLNSSLYRVWKSISISPDNAKIGAPSFTLKVGENKLWGILPHHHHHHHPPLPAQPSCPPTGPPREWWFGGKRVGKGRTRSVLPAPHSSLKAALTVTARCYAALGRLRTSRNALALQRSS